jgi:hypothetical protein
LRNYLPGFIKPIIRFIYYKNERRKVFSNPRVRKDQNRRILSIAENTKKLIVFIVPGADWFTGKDAISGGILSVASICEETKKLQHIHEAEVIMATLPGEYLLVRHTMFPNEIDVFRFGQITKHFGHLEQVLFHIPEYMIPTFTGHWRKEHRKFSAIQVHVNVLNQRIDIMPEPWQINELRGLVNKVTQTTAHEKYTTLENRQKFGIPLHKLSVFGSPERYNRTPLESKKKIITFSPDPHPLKDELIELLRLNLSEYKIREVRNLTYTDYLAWTAETQFTITLGEGLDFYFIETVFSGGVAFALDKKDFFTDEFRDVPGIYGNMKDLMSRIVGDMTSLFNATTYKDWNAKQYQACAGIYKFEEYVENLKKFYRGDYTYA